MDNSADLVEVEVEFDYEAELADELTIKTGDIIKEVKRMEGGWWEGSLGGKRGVFPDNFVKVLTTDNPKAKPKAPTVPSPVALPSTTTAKSSEDVQLRRGQQFRSSANQNRKKCRVLFSYQPKHDDELELKMDEIVEFMAEVEDGWWKGKLRGRVGVFPSNFVEMVKGSAAADETEEMVVADKNKRNEKLKVEKVAAARPASSKISSLIQEAESKASKKKASLENLNLMKRESPLGGEEMPTKSSDDLANAPRLPPKPGPRLDPNNNQDSQSKTLKKGKHLPLIEVTPVMNDEFNMDPLETLSPFDFLAPLRQDDSVFFVGSLTAGKPSRLAEPKSRLKRVLSAPKSLNRRKSLGNLFSKTKNNCSAASKASSINEDSDFETASVAGSFKSSWSFIFGGGRERSKSETSPKIEHPHSYSGIAKITRGSQTSPQLGGASIWSSQYKHRAEVSTQTELKHISPRNRIITNPRATTCTREE